MQFQSEKHWRCVFCFKHWSVLCHHFCGPEKRTLWSCDSPGYMMLYDFMGGHRWLVVHCCWQELYERHVGQLSQQIRNSQDWKMERKRLWNSIPLGCGKWRFIRVMVCDGGVWHPGEGGASQNKRWIRSPNFVLEPTSKIQSWMVDVGWYSKLTFDPTGQNIYLLWAKIYHSDTLFNISHALVAFEWSRI